MDKTIPLRIDPIYVNTTSPLRVATGYGQGLLDRTVVRRRRIVDPEYDKDIRDVYLPASSFKGRLRHTCERLAAGAGLYVCQAPAPETMCNSLPERKGRLCLVCRIFGTPGRASGLIFHDAVLTDELAGLLTLAVKQVDGKVSHYAPFGQTVERTQVQLNRRQGIAEPEHLFNSELVAEGMIFVTHITGRLPATLLPDGIETFELLLLLAGLVLVDAFGGGRSTGSGRSQTLLPKMVEWDRTSLVCDDVLGQVGQLSKYPDPAERRR